MQFVRNGPDVPERLLQAHEDERLVLFCGAGVSGPAGLPGFATLVDQVFLAFPPDPVQQAALEAKQFDKAIGLLEEGMLDGRNKVRRRLAEILTPSVTTRNATATHEALLTLSRNHDGRTRLVTTNFDRLFEKAIADKGLLISRVIRLRCCRYRNNDGMASCTCTVGCQTRQPIKTWTTSSSPVAILAVLT